MSSSPHRRLALVALTCPACGGSLDPLPDDRVYFCAACGGACELIGRSLAPREIAFLGDTADPAVVFLPFWVLGAGRDSHGKARPVGRAARIVPSLDSSRVLTLSRWYTERSDTLGPVSAKPGRGLWGGSLGSGDARRIGALASRRPAQREAPADYPPVPEGASSLAALPFVPGSDRFVCALTGLHVYFATLPGAAAILDRWSGPP